MPVGCEKDVLPAPLGAVLAHPTADALMSCQLKHSWNTH